MDENYNKWKLDITTNKEFEIFYYILLNAKNN